MKKLYDAVMCVIVATIAGLIVLGTIGHANAMSCSMTRPQMDVLKAAAIAEPSISAAVSSGNDNAVAAWFNELASPAYVVWKTSITAREMHAAYVWAEMDNLSQAKFNQLTLMLQPGAIDPSVPNIRQGITDVFAGAQLAATRAALVALAKRDATNAEKLLASGTGSSGSPGTMACSGPVTSN